MKDFILIRVVAVFVAAASILAAVGVADAQLFDFNPWWPGWDMAWWN